MRFDSLSSILRYMEVNQLETLELFYCPYVRMYSQYCLDAVLALSDNNLTQINPFHIAKICFNYSYDRSGERTWVVLTMTSSVKFLRHTYSSSCDGTMVKWRFVNDNAISIHAISKAALSHTSLNYLRCWIGNDCLTTDEKTLLDYSFTALHRDLNCLIHSIRAKEKHYKSILLDKKTLLSNYSTITFMDKYFKCYAKDPKDKYRFVRLFCHAISYITACVKPWQSKYIALRNKNATIPQLRDIQNEFNWKRFNRFYGALSQYYNTIPYRKRQEYFKSNRF